MFKYKLEITLFLFTVLSSQFCFGDRVDSLQQMLVQTHDIEKKIELQTMLAKEYQLSDINEARRITDKAFQLSKTSNNSVYLGEIYGLFGDIAVLQDSLPEAGEYYRNALIYFSKNSDTLGIIGVSSVLGNIAKTQDDFSLAMKYYQKTVDYANSAGLKDWIPSIYLNIGSIYYETGQYNEAIEYFNIALEEAIKFHFPWIEGETFNYLGLTYLQLGDLSSAKQYFDKSIVKLKDNESYVRASMSMQNLALVYQKEGKYIQALETLDQSASLFEKGDKHYAGPKLVIIASHKIRSGTNNLYLGNYEKAHDFLSEGLDLSRINGQIKLASIALEQLANYWDIIGNTDSAYYYYKLFTGYKDSLNTKDKIRKLALQEAKFKHNEELVLQQQARENESSQNRLYLIILGTIIIILVLLSALLFLFIKLGQNKIKQGEFEQKELKEKLELANKELTTHLMYQVKNNEFYINISKKLKNLISTASPENKKLLFKLIKEIELDSSTSLWDEFEIRFQQVHVGFYKNLGKKYPELTPNELRICAFLKLNMNTKDIAAITFQSANSIGVARHRLRQKFGLDKEENLTSFLTQY